MRSSCIQTYTTHISLEISCHGKIVREKMSDSTMEANTVFGWSEIEKKEIKEREVGEKDHTSPVWYEGRNGTIF